MPQVYAHQDETLESHLLRVNKFALSELKKRKAFINSKLYNRLYKLIDIVTKLHDVGKATSFFQQYLAGNKKIDSELKAHSHLSALIALIYLETFETDFNLFDKLVVYTVIKRHHSNLKHFYTDVSGIFKIICENEIYKKQLQNINEQAWFNLFEAIGLEKIRTADILNSFEKLKSLFLEFRKQNSKGWSVDNFITLNLVYSFLIGADKRKTAIPQEEQKSNIVFPEDLIDEYKKLKFKDIPNTLLNILRESTYKQAEENLLQFTKDNLSKGGIFTLTLPTGMGKTLNAFNLAIKLQNVVYRKYNYAPDIIYSIPFISIIDQTENVFKEILDIAGRDIKSKKNLLFSSNHSLANIKEFHNEEKLEKYSIDDETGSEDKILERISRAQLLNELWDSKLTFTTYVQLLNSIFTNRNKFLKRMYKFIGAIVILDEVQNIDSEYWELVDKTFTYLSQNFGVKFIFMSATMPLIFSGGTKELVKNFKEIYRQLNRIELNIKIEEKENFSDFVSKVNIKPDKNYLFVFNTIKSSQEAYKQLQNRLGNSFKLFYLSTRIIPKHRLTRIKKIKRLIEKEKNIILISTQVIEAGVDLDFDVVYRDFAPLDSINQTAGRCNRNFDPEKRGQVFIRRLIDDINKTNEDSNLNTKEFASYIYDITLLDATRKILKEGKHSESKIVKYNEEYFKETRERKNISKWLEPIKSLNYCSPDSQNLSFCKFNLIKKTYATIDLFINLNKESTKLWKRYESLFTKEKDPIKRKIKFLEFKHKFSSYVISIPFNEQIRKNIPLPFIENSLIRWEVNKMESEYYYDHELGFTLRNEEDNSFII